MSEHTPTPWTYRPHEHDDWGFIRGPKDPIEKGWPLVAIARSGRFEDLDEHRMNSTDPYAANGALIVRAVNAYADLVQALELARRFIDPTCDPPRLNNRDMCEMIRAALAKAKALEQPVGAGE